MTSECDIAGVNVQKMHPVRVMPDTNQNFDNKLMNIIVKKYKKIKLIKGYEKRDKALIKLNRLYMYAFYG